MQSIDLDLDKDNELIFKVSVEGTKPTTSRSRFLLEASNFSLAFPAQSLTNGEVSVLIPPLEKVIKEGTYEGLLEVIVDDRVFTPIKISTDFKQSLKVVAESVVRKKQETTVTALVNDVRVNRQPIEKIKKEAIIVSHKPTIENKVLKETIVPEVPVLPSVNKIKHTQSVKSTHKVEKPAQRNRIRPLQRNEKKRNIDESHRQDNKKKALSLIEKIAKRNGAILSEAQLEEVLRQYHISKQKRQK